MGIWKSSKHLLDGNGKVKVGKNENKNSEVIYITQWNNSLVDVVPMEVETKTHQ